MILFRVDGVVVGMAFKNIDSDEQLPLARARFYERRAAIAECDATRALRNFAVLQPQAKFILAAAMQLLLAALLTVLPTEGARYEAAMLLLWTAQSAALELRELIEHWPLWRADPFNALELTSSMLASLSLSLRLMNARPQLVPAALSVAITLQITAQSCRLLERTPTFGPLVVMALNMVNDTARYLVLIGGLLAGFACGLYALLKASRSRSVSSPFTGNGTRGRALGGGEARAAGGTSSETVDGGQERCSALDASPGASLIFELGLGLFQTMLGSDDDLINDACLRSSDSPLVGTLFMDAYLVLAVLLGTNMLIALMAKSACQAALKLRSNHGFLGRPRMLSHAGRSSCDL